MTTVQLPTSGGSTMLASHDLGLKASAAAVITALEAAGGASGIRMSSVDGLTGVAWDGVMCGMFADLTVVDPGIAAVLEGTDPWSWSSGTGLELDADGLVALGLGSTWAPGSSAIFIKSTLDLGTEANGDHLDVGFESQAQSGRAVTGGMTRTSGTWRSATGQGIPDSSFALFGAASTFTPASPSVMGRVSLHAYGSGVDRAADLNGNTIGPNGHFGIATGSTNRLGSVSDGRIVLSGAGGDGHIVTGLMVLAAWRL